MGPRQGDNSSPSLHWLRAEAVGPGFVHVHNVHGKHAHTANNGHATWSATIPNFSLHGSLVPTPFTKNTSTRARILCEGSGHQTSYAETE